PDLVPSDELLAMSSLTVYSWNAGRIVGPLLGSVLAHTAGAAWTVAINAMTFAVLAVAGLALRRRVTPVDRMGGSIKQRLALGWATARRVHGCLLGIAIIAIMNVSVSPFMGLIPAYVTKTFHGGVSMVGLFGSLQGTGAIFGILIATALSFRLGRARVMLAVVC